MAVTVALVEDHADTRDALVRLLGDYPERVEVVSAFADAESFLSFAELPRIAVALVDLGLPRMSGCDAILALSRRTTQLRCVALTTTEDEETVFEAMRAGAHGYMLKDESPLRLVRAVEEAAEGSHPLSSRIAGFLVARARLRPPPILLTSREEEVALALASGASYAECAERLGIAVGTVQAFVKLVYRKLDVTSKKELREWISLNRP